VVGYTKIKLESMILYDTKIRNWTGLTIKWHKIALDSDSEVIADCKVNNIGNCVSIFDAEVSRS
jgi:hypothetical protein